MALTVYRWDDVSAPVLNCTIPKSYALLLKAILVDGYGAKLGAGWTVGVDDIATNGVIILRNSSTTGTGRYFRIQDNGYYNETAGVGGVLTQMATVRGCESFSDANTTSGNFPNIGFQGDSNADTATHTGVTHFKGDNVGDTAVPWVITADERTINIFIMVNENSAVEADMDHLTDYNWLVLGDVEPLNSSVNPNACVCWGNGFKTGYASTSIGGATGLAGIVGEKYLNRGYQANAGAIEHGYISVVETRTNTNRCGILSLANDLIYAYPDARVGGMVFGGIYVFEDVSAVESNGIDTIDTQTIQAKMRGVLSLGHQVNSGVTVTTGPGTYFDTITIEGDDYMLFGANDSTNPCSILIQITGDM